MTPIEIVGRALGEAMCDDEATLTLGEASWAEIMEALLIKQARDEGEELVGFTYELEDVDDGEAAS